MADAKVENPGGGSNSPVAFRGLTEEERGELSKITEQIGELQRFAHTGRRIGRMLGAAGESWDVLLADCADARDEAQKAQEARTASR